MKNTFCSDYLSAVTALFSRTETTSANQRWFASEKLTAPGESERTHEVCGSDAGFHYWSWFSNKAVAVSACLKNAVSSRLVLTKRGPTNFADDFPANRTRQRIPHKNLIKPETLPYTPAQALEACRVWGSGFRSFGNDLEVSVQG